jgi:hypothetical protein
MGQVLIRAATKQHQIQPVSALGQSPWISRIQENTGQRQQPNGHQHSELSGWVTESVGIQGEQIGHQIHNAHKGQRRKDDAHTYHPRTQVRMKPKMMSLYQPPT